MGEGHLFEYYASMREFTVFFDSLNPAYMIYGFFLGTPAMDRI